MPETAAQPAAPRSGRVEWIALGVFALVAVALGYAGFAELDDGGTTASLYRSLQLFVLESGAIDARSVPWTLEIARILAPALAAYAAIRGVFLLFRDELQSVAIRRWRGHVVIAGLGEKGFTLARALHADGRKVLVVEPDATNPRIAGCRQRGIHVLAGHGGDRVTLVRARALDASHVVALTASNKANLEIAFALRALATTGRRSDAPVVHVHVDDLMLWRLLQAELIATAEASPVRIEFFNIYDAAARTLVEHVSPLRTSPEPEGGHRLLVLGAGPLAGSVVLHAARAALGVGGLPPLNLGVTLAGPRATAELAELVARHPRLREVVELDAWDVDHEALTVEAEVERALDATFVVVDLEDEQESLQAALTLSGQPRLRRCPTVLVVDDEIAGLATGLRAAGALSRLTPFGVLSRTLTPDLLGGGTNELLAEAKHRHYVECELERGSTRANNPSLVPWPELPESLKESNRLFADSCGRKLAAAGCTVVPAPLPDAEQAGFEFPDDLLEHLARSEHERWVEDLVGQGWRPGDTKDPERKLHPKLVPWEELDEDDRDKDREPVRALPRMLARIGFAVAPLDAASPGARVQWEETRRS